MSKPKFMVFKLRDLWVPIIVTIVAVLMVVFFISKFTATKPTFAPQQDYSNGDYVTKISLDNADFNVAVSIHKNAITSVELRNMDEQAKMMYPLFESSMDYINGEITKTQSLEIAEFPPAKETTEFLMAAVRDALSLSEQTVDSPADSLLDNGLLEDNVEDYIISNPEMSDQAYIDWEVEIDQLLEDEIEQID